MTSQTDVTLVVAVPEPVPPIAQKVPKTDVVHNETRVDNYFWLRDKDNPEVARYLEAENAYADALTQHTTALQGELYREMVSHIKETDIGVPFREGSFFYYTRTEAGKQYPIFCRKQTDGDMVNEGAPEEVILDQNVLAEGQAFMSLGGMSVSEDGNLLAYSTDNTGFRQFTLYIRNLQTGKLFAEQMEKTGSFAWATDNRTLFYTVEEEGTKRHYRVYRHLLGTNPSTDVVVYEDADERFNVGVELTRSREYLLIESGSHTTSEWRRLRADQPLGEWSLIAPRVQDQEYQVDHRGDEFFIRVNDTGRNFRLVSAPIAQPGRENWKEIIPHRADVMLAGMDFFADFYVLMEREDGLPHFRITDFSSGDWHRMSFPEPAYSAFPAQNREWKTDRFRYSYQSMVTPNSIYDYDITNRQSTLLKRTEVPGYDQSQYQAERIYAAAADGARIPISLVYRKGFRRDGSDPMLLTGYGAYGYTYPVNFSSNILSLLDRDFVFAIAHIRGGGDLGKAWHDQGRMMNKKNTFTDFITAAQHLVDQRYTSSDRLIATGTSAGGLLMGAIANMRPELFKAVIARVPFLDVINTMLDETLPLTVPEYEEWGNPHEKPAYDYMLAYSPYDQLEAKPYPALLVKTSFNDSQVMYWEPAKYVAKLRTLKKDSNPLLLKTNMAAGHGGASGRYDLLRETAFEYAFMLWQVGKA